MLRCVVRRRSRWQSKVHHGIAARVEISVLHEVRWLTSTWGLGGWVCRGVIWITIGGGLPLLSCGASVASCCAHAPTLGCMQGGLERKVLLVLPRYKQWFDSWVVFLEGCGEDCWVTESFALLGLPQTMYCKCCMHALR